MARKNLGDAFGGKITTLEEQRAIWLDALHEDAIWEGPTFEIPVTLIGCEAVGRFMEFLLSVVPRFSTKTVAVYPTADPDTTIVESSGGGDTVDGGPLYPALFHADHHQKRSGVPNARICQSVPDLQEFREGALGTCHRRDRGEAQRPWPASQPPDPIVLPPLR